MPDGRVGAAPRRGHRSRHRESRDDDGHPAVAAPLVALHSLRVGPAPRHEGRPRVRRRFRRDGPAHAVAHGVGRSAGSLPKLPRRVLQTVDSSDGRRRRQRPGVPGSGLRPGTHDYDDCRGGTQRQGGGRGRTHGLDRRPHRAIAGRRDLPGVRQPADRVHRVVGRPGVRRAAPRRGRRGRRGGTSCPTSAQRPSARGRAGGLRRMFDPCRRAPPDRAGRPGRGHALPQRAVCGDGREADHRLELRRQARRTDGDDGDGGVRGTPVRGLDVERLRGLFTRLEAEQGRVRAELARRRDDQIRAVAEQFAHLDAALADRLPRGSGPDVPVDVEDHA